MSDAKIVREALEWDRDEQTHSWFELGDAPLTALDRLERERAAGEAIFVELFQVALDAHGRLVDRNEALESQNQALQERAEKAEVLLVRLHGWDIMDTTSDGPYWQREIDQLLSLTPGD